MFFLIVRDQFSQQHKTTNNINFLYISICISISPWSLTLREERRLKVFENRVLRRVFGPKRDEVTAE
jgi:hypothetical protein